jgi:hypothetical protein
MNCQINALVCTCDFSDCYSHRRVVAHVAFDPECLLTLRWANIQGYGSGASVVESMNDCRPNAAGPAGDYGYLACKLRLTPKLISSRSLPGQPRERFHG